MKKILWLLIIGLLAASPVLANHSRVLGISIPAPMLYAPNETVTIKANAPVEFRWEPLFLAPQDYWYFDFRIYKGGNQVASTLIHKERISPRQTSVLIKSDLFENGQSYSWSLRIAGQLKGRSNFSMFKVVKQ